MINGISWRELERLVAAMFADEFSVETTVVPNAKIRGKVSGVQRQIDVLVDARIQSDYNRRIIVDAKKRTGKVDINDVEMFEGMMRDCSASHGVLVCLGGYTEGALRRAQKTITLRLVTDEELANFTVSGWEPCLGKCQVTRAPTHRGLVLYIDSWGFAAADNSLFRIVMTGKCDVCTDFHVWCWDCGIKISVGRECIERCECPCFWGTSVEDDADESGKSRKSLYLHLLSNPVNGSVYPVIQTVDRIPLD